MELELGDLLYEVPVEEFQKLNKEANKRGLQAAIFDITYDEEGEEALTVSFEVVKMISEMT